MLLLINAWEFQGETYTHNRKEVPFTDTSLVFPARISNGHSARVYPNTLRRCSMISSHTSPIPRISDSCSRPADASSPMVLIRFCLRPVCTLRPKSRYSIGISAATSGFLVEGQAPYGGQSRNPADKPLAATCLLAHQDSASSS